MPDVEDPAPDHEPAASESDPPAPRAPVVAIPTHSVAFRDTDANAANQAPGSTENGQTGESGENGESEETEESGETGETGEEGAEEDLTEIEDLPDAEPTNLPPWPPAAAQGAPDTSPKPPAQPPAKPPARRVAYTGEEPGDEAGRMGFLDHLLELRRRLLICAIALAVCIGFSMAFYKPVWAFLNGPITEVNRRYQTQEDLRVWVQEKGFNPAEPVIQPISTNPLGIFWILMKVGFWAGVVLSSPVLVYEIWAFIAPGLLKHERGAIRPVLAAGVFLFLGGAAFCYYLVFPLTLEFLVWLSLDLGIRPQYTPEEYIGLLLNFMLVFGIMFEAPLVSSVLAALGLLKPAWLTRYWRHIIVACFVAGAVLSPGSDPLSMLIMSGCMVVLYALSVVLARWFYPKHAAAEA
jgi:sec-independent protein translocase protein TatC